MALYFTLAELGGLTATAQARANLEGLTMPRLDTVRAAVGVPLRVTSGYRSPERNAAVGGSPTSDHVHGLAADLKADIPDSNGKLLHYSIVQQRIVEAAKRGDLAPFDQIIFYPYTTRHIHVGYGPRMRGQFLVKLAGDGYSPFVDESGQATPLSFGILAVMLLVLLNLWLWTAD